MKAPGTGRTAELLALIESRPGITTEQICAAMGINNSNARNVLSRIKPHIITARLARSACFYPVGWDESVDEDREEIEIPRADPAAVIAAAMRSRTPLELAWSAA